MSQQLGNEVERQGKANKSMTIQSSLFNKITCAHIYTTLYEKHFFSHQLYEEQETRVHTSTLNTEYMYTP